ncbi:MAG: hypothetical protein PF541_12445 [Prolixibacteraceae bacterium]|jgi:nitrate/nitrite-specific signal transduction histidine kinase|nr:hypothetical protein [Prolixibacteraceae bacterium]
MKSIKTKFMMITGAIFLVSYIVLVLNLGSNSKIALQSSSLLKDNYPSVKYSFTMLDALERWNGMVNRVVVGDSILQSALMSESKLFYERFEEALKLQGENITETGEGELTQILDNTYSRFKASNEQKVFLTNYTSYNLAYLHLRESIVNIQSLNVKVLEKKNAQINESSTRIANIQQKIGIAALVVLCFLTFFLPYVLINPVEKLTNRLMAIYRKDFNKEIKLEKKHEIDNLEEVLNKILQEVKQHVK